MTLLLEPTLAHYLLSGLFVLAVGFCVAKAIFDIFNQEEK